MKVIPIILCGGAGTRLWPLSREQYPKQLLSLVDDGSLLQNTVARCASRPGIAPPVLVCNEEHRFLVAEQMRHLAQAPATILLEPVAKNTAPALALGAGLVMQGGEDAVLPSGEDAVLIVQPSDHLIPDAEAFLAAIDEAVQLAEQDYLVTFGIKPTRPETGYGYIKVGAAIENSTGALVDQFVEKPDSDTAKQYLAKGDYLWNSGIFVLKASRYLEELAAHRPEVARACQTAVAGHQQDMNFTRIDADAFAACPEDSIDYAVMEQTKAAAVIPLDAGWSDLGSWDTLWEASPRDSQGNAIKGDVLVQDVSGSYVQAEHRLVSVVGVADLVVVETADAVLVAARDEAQQVKAIVENLKSCDRDEQTVHRRVYRPWGHYDSVDAGDNFQVKRLTVAPGASLSLQRHAKRAEHWVVVQGTATVTIDDKQWDLEVNEHAHIPKGAKHRLQNRTKQSLEIIEVQSGSYLGEDDIERFDDIYGRDA